MNDLEFADDIALLEPPISPGPTDNIQQKQQKNLGLIVSVPKTEYMTTNCHLQPSLQVYGESINHVTDFKYLGSKMASAASDFK